MRHLQEQLEFHSGKRIQLRINDNHSTMLSVKWESHCTKVSLHRMFLQAPTNIMEALACYIKKKNEKMSPYIRTFIDENVKKLDYSHLIDSTLLSVEGNVYQLDQLFDEVNREYFSGELPLRITWFGHINQRNRSRITFGLYHDPLKLIKIHRMLDDSSYPEYLVKFVIYHEMLHYVCPAYRDARGIHRIHSKEFKLKEKEFKQYHHVQKWLKENRERLFKCK